MLYLKRDLYVGRSLALYGEFSEIEAAFLASYAPADGVAVDAGANIGAHTLVLARAVGPRGMVIAAEPQRAVFQILCANLALNEIRNAHAFHCALGAAAGRTKIPAFDYRQENNYGGVSAGAERGETVRVQTVDGLSLPRLDLLKIDVEGWEAEVLRGAAASIKRHRPVLYVEADRMDKAGDSGAYAVDGLRDLSTPAAAVQPQELRRQRRERFRRHGFGQPAGHSQR